VRARQIVEERARAPFDRVDDLLRVHGIGPKTLENLRPAVAANRRARKSGSVDFPACRSEAVRDFRVGAGGKM
jgi:predicted flap endonuclease-1-like 5' DNA nuclease